MPPTRHFLGYDQPALHTAVGWLIERYAQPAALDLSGVIMAVPGGRAGRRLLQALVERWEAGPAGPLAPPRIVTVGALPECLYEADGVLGDHAALLARAAAVHDADPEDVRLALGEPPAEDDTVGWVRAAGELAAVIEELLGGGRRPADAAEATGDDRWHAITRLDQRYRDLLERYNAMDRPAARLAVADTRNCRLHQDVVLLGVAELPGVARVMLEQVADRVTALVFASDHEAEAFDAFGLLRAEAWQDRTLGLRDEQVVTADRPSDQALAALGAIDEASRHESISADQVTIGVGDPALSPPIVRRLEAADVPARQPPGTRLAESRPALLLGAAAAFLRSRRLDDLAALARHPDLDLDAPGVTHWQTLLDDYITDHVQARVTADWFGEHAEHLKAAYDQLMALLPDESAKLRPLPRWSQPLAATLAAVYGPRTLDPASPGDALELGALSMLADALAAMGELDGSRAFIPQVTAAEAIALLMQRLGDAVVPSAPDREAVEVLGYLELLLDDAPVTVIAGVNEGMIPSSRASDPLLPDALRGRLGLPDNRQRYARDLYVLHAVTRSRPRTTLITGRRAAAGDPLLPSRLLLACDDATMVARINAFYDGTPAAAAPPLVAPGRRDDLGLRIPPPLAPLEPITSLRVTAFRDYLASPYRFYLRHVLRLRGVDDTAVEMSGSGFGNLAHRVLRAFGQSDLAGATDADTIAAYLADRLRQVARSTFGDEPVAAVALQLQQLDERLARFAAAQAAAAREGWRILPDHIERRREAALEVDGQPFVVTGQIDRVDEHPELGYRIVDYKTADASKPPDAVHLAGRRGDRRWIDLQLPLYRELAAAAGIEGAVEVGYALLPRKLADVGFAWADWPDEQLDEAIGVAHDVVRDVRRGVFWPPGDVPAFEDDYTAVCFDRVTDRAAVIAASISESGADDA